MINPNCPLSDKEKFYVIMKGECLQNTLGFDHCKNCPYMEKRTIILSNIRRAYPRLIANDVFGIQPMAKPIGSVFKFKLRKNRKRK